MIDAAGLSIDFAIRPASQADVPAMDDLIIRSARRLGEGFYTRRETEAAIAHVFGVDAELIADSSYFLATDAAGTLLGCGGWSRRATLFGGDRYAGRVAGMLDPAHDPARIRAFFVDPDHARRGVASALLARCSEEARAMGFSRLALMATRPGVPFYRRHGFVEDTAVSLQLGDIAVEFVPMSREL
jgi:GNAT superfamily N-acetyltransferase